MTLIRVANGEIDRVGPPCNIRIPVTINRHAVAKIVDCSAKIGRVTQHGINNQVAASIIGSNLESELVCCGKDVGTGDEVPCAAAVDLIHPRALQAKFAAPESHDGIPRGVELYPRGAVEGDADGLGIGGWLNDHIVFQLSIASVKVNVDTRIKIREPHLGIVRNPRVPSLGSVADEVIAVT